LFKKVFVIEIVHVNWLWETKRKDRVCRLHTKWVLYFPPFVTYKEKIKDRATGQVMNELSEHSVIAYIHTYTHIALLVNLTNQQVDRLRIMKFYLEYHSSIHSFKCIASDFFFSRSFIMLVYEFSYKFIKTLKFSSKYFFWYWFCFKKIYFDDSVFKILWRVRIWILWW